MARTMVLAVLLALLGACGIGPRAASTPLAHEPRGANVVLQTATRSLQGELLEVQDTALVVLTEMERITLIPFRTIHQGRAELAGHFVARRGSAPTPERLDRLRRVSRFPQGLTPEMRRTLLAAYSQTQMEVETQ